MFRVEHKTRKNVYLVLRHKVAGISGKNRAVWIAGETRGTRFERIERAQQYADAFNGAVQEILQLKG